MAESRSEGRAAGLFSDTSDRSAIRALRAMPSLDRKHAVIFCIQPVRFSKPSRISISPTLNSMDRPTRGGITTPHRMMRQPTTKMVNVWPSPQRPPIKAAPRRPRCLVTMVEMATT